MGRGEGMGTGQSDLHVNHNKLNLLQRSPNNNQTQF